MESECKIVINRREGKSFRQLYINENVPLERRVEIVSQEFDAPKDKVSAIVGDVASFLLDGPGSVFSQSEFELNRGREVQHIFRQRLRDLGISRHHADNLVFGVAGEIVAERYPEIVDRNSLEFVRIPLRHQLIERLFSPLGQL